MRIDYGTDWNGFKLDFLDKLFPFWYQTLLNEDDSLYGYDVFVIRDGFEAIHTYQGLLIVGVAGYVLIDYYLGARLIKFFKSINENIKELKIEKEDLENLKEAYISDVVENMTVEDIKKGCTKAIEKKYDNATSKKMVSDLYKKRRMSDYYG
jgi:hypothetical protein